MSVLKFILYPIRTLIAQSNLLTNFFMSIQQNCYNSLINKLIPDSSFYSLSEYTLVKTKNATLKLSLGEYTSHEIAFNKTLTYNNAILKLLPQNEQFSILDIGAFIGEKSILFAQKNLNDLVYSFEPNINIFNILNENISINHLSNISTLNIALGAEKTIAYSGCNVPNNISGSIISKEKTNLKQVFNEVQVDNLDNLLKEKTFKYPVKFIKIDIEGFEFEVLKGAVQLITEYKPIIVTEIDDKFLKNNHSSALETLQFIAQFGYQFKHLESNKSIDLNDEHLLIDCHWDVVAAPIV